MSELNTVGMNVIIVNNRWKMIIYFMHSLVLVGAVLMWNKWLFFLLFFTVSLSYNALVNGQFWMMPREKRNNERST